MILPACPPGNAPDVLKRLRDATPEGQTVSGGIATWDRTESAESLLARADRALYDASTPDATRLVTASAG